MKKCKTSIDKKTRDDIVKMVFDDKGVTFGPPRTGGPFPYLDLDTGRYLFVDLNGKIIWNTKSAVKDLCRAHGIEPPEVFPGVRIIYDPTERRGFHYRPDGNLLNTYQPSKYQGKNLKVVRGPFPTISKLIVNIFPDHDTRDAFLNWLSVVFNEGVKTGTAWVIMGSQGSGKNTLFSKIIAPLLGPSNCRMLNQDSLESRFNKLLDERQMVCFNEVKASPKAQDRLKTWITEDEFVMEDKGKSSEIRSNVANMIFLSNNHVPVLLDEDDRRFSVVKTGPPLRNLSWFKGSSTLKDIERELGHFAWFLKEYDYDVEEAKVPVVNDTKIDLIERSLDAADVFARRLKANDSDWVVSQIDRSKYSASELSDLSGFQGRLAKNLAVKVYEDIFQEKISTNSLTRNLKDRGFGDCRGKEKNGARIREYTWTE